MRKLDLLHLSSQLTIANNNDVSPNPGVPAASLLVPEPPAPRARDVLEPHRGGAGRGRNPAVRGHAPAVPLPRALRPRRRS